ncbi:MAG: mechanosensitive ion channel family protein [Nitrospinota bacterium]
MDLLEINQTFLVHLGTALGLAGLAFGLLQLLKSKILAQSPPKNPTFRKTYDLIQGLLSKTRWFFVLILSIYFGSLVLNLPGPVAKKIGQVVFIVLLIQIGLWGTWWLSHWAKVTFKAKKESDSAQASAIGLLKIIGQTVLWVILIVAGLSNLGFEVSTLVAGLGVGGIAIALASQKILGDLFASLTIILDKPFVVGDYIVSNDIRGTVKKIGLKTTLVRSLEGEMLILPNSDLLESRLRNFRRMEERRALISIGVVYQTPLEKLKIIPKLVREIIEGQENTRFDRAHFKEYGPHSLNFEIVYFLTSRDYHLYMDTLQEVNLKIFELFEKEKIEFAYPTQTVFLEGKDENKNS